MLIDLLAAGASAAPQNKFGFVEALNQGGFIAYATVYPLTMLCRILIAQIMVLIFFR